MTEEIEFILDSTEESMIGSIAHLKERILNIRAGKASPAMLGSVCRLLRLSNTAFAGGKTKCS
jgi:ribosome recycling factor